MTVEQPIADSLAAPSRTRGRRHARRHSRRVRILRIGLPVVAAAIVAAFFVSFRSLPSGVEDADLGDVGIEGTTVTMDNPQLSGFNTDGMGYDVTAKRAVQDLRDTSVVQLEGISGKATQPDGGWAELTASSGVYNTQSELLTLERDILINTHDGKSGRLDDVSVDIRDQRIEAKNGVELTMPGGRVTADRLIMLGEREVIRLEGGVRVTLRMDGGEIKEARDAPE